MSEYVTMLRNNVEIVVTEDKVEGLKKEGFEVLEDGKVEKSGETKKTLEDMKIEELKELAKEKGIENFKNLTKAELLKVLAK